MSQATEIINEWLAEASQFAASNYRPLVTLSYAQSLDGSIAARRGASIQLSGPLSMQLTHQLRAAHDAILVGIGTILADDPRLTVRLADGPDPQPVVLDSHLRFPAKATLLQHPRPPWIAICEQADRGKLDAPWLSQARLIPCPANPAGQVDLHTLLQKLAAQGINSLMVEGGARVITSFLKERLVDQIFITVSPVFIGGLPAIQGPLVEEGDVQKDQGFPSLSALDCEKCGQDLILWGKLERVRF